MFRRVCEIRSVIWGSIVGILDGKVAIVTGGGQDGIRVNTIVPFASSKGLEEWFAERPEESAAFLATVAMRYADDCEKDIGRFVVALCGPDSRYITGQTIALDGGQALLV